MLSKEFNAFLYEFKYDVLRQTRYRFKFFTDVLVWAIVFGLILFLNKDIGSSDKVWLLIGYSYWQISFVAFGQSAGIVEGESLTGMLEIKLTSTSSIVALFLARLLANILVCVLIQIVVVIAALTAGILTWGNVSYYVLAMLLYIPSLLGMFGMGLLFGGFALRVKQLGQLILLVQMAFLLFANILNMTSNIVYGLIPYSMGMELARSLFSQSSISLGEMMGYIFINISWLIIGTIVFYALLRKNKKTGYFHSY